MNQRGFTLIELVIVLVILGLLAITAAPRFLGLQTEARANVIENLRGTFEETHRRMQMKAAVPGALLPIEGSEQFWLDVNGNGTVDSDSGDYDQSTLYGKDGIDILLIDDRHIDNHQLLKLVAIDDGLKAVVGSNKHQAYVGFDTLGDGDIRAGNCRVYYDQNSFQSRTDGC